MWEEKYEKKRAWEAEWGMIWRKEELQKWTLKAPLWYKWDLILIIRISTQSYSVSILYLFKATMANKAKKISFFPPKLLSYMLTIIISFVQQVNTMLFTPILLENNWQSYTILWSLEGLKSQYSLPMLKNFLSNGKSLSFFFLYNTIQYY